jgi:hypothetical protein
LEAAVYARYRVSIGGADDQFDARLTRSDEQRIDISLAVGNHNQARGWRERLLHVLQRGESALAFAFDLWALARLLSLGGGIARPNRLIKEPKRHAIKSSSQSGTHLQAGTERVIEVTEAADVRWVV